MIKEYGYEYEVVIDKDLYEKTKDSCTHELIAGAIALRSGRDALKAIAREYSPCVALIPTLACDSMFTPFAFYGHKVYFYKINEDYSIDIDDIKKNIGNTKAETFLFLYMDYFGNRACSDEVLFELRQDKRIVFIEDRTHNLLSKTAYNFTPDYTLASLRKWTSIPDGGLLWANKSLKNFEFGEDTTFAKTRLKAQCTRSEYFSTGDELLKKEFRQIFSHVTDMIDSDPLPGRMSKYSYQKVMSEDWDGIKKQRRENARTIIDILSNSPIKFIQKDETKSSLYVPILLEDRTERQSILSNKGIFNTIIWPLIDDQKKCSYVAKYTEEHMLAITCDQRYTKEDMEYTALEMRRVFNA